MKPKTTSFLGYPKVILYTKFEHFGPHSLLSYAPDIQTYKTDRFEHPTHADRQSNNYNSY